MKNAKYYELGLVLLTGKMFLTEDLLLLTTNQLSDNVIQKLEDVMTELSTERSQIQIVRYQHILVLQDVQIHSDDPLLAMDNQLLHSNLLRFDITKHVNLKQEYVIIEH